MQWSLKQKHNHKTNSWNFKKNLNIQGERSVSLVSQKKEKQIVEPLCTIVIKKENQLRTAS